MQKYYLLPRINYTNVEPTRKNLISNKFIVPNITTLAKRIMTKTSKFLVIYYQNKIVKKRP